MRLIYFQLTLLMSLSFSGISTHAQSTLLPEIEPGVTRELAIQRKAVLSEINYEIELRLPADQQQAIAATEALRFQLSDASHPLVLDFRESADKIRSVEVNGEESVYEFASEHLIVPSAELKIGVNRIDIQFIAGESSLNRNPDFLYTLFVPDRARTAFPMFDQPNLKATYDLSLIMPADWDAISNAPLLESEDLGTNKRLRFARSDLISSYLFSFVAGKFQRVTRSVNGREMSMLHRESDAEKVARNVDAVFELHGAALSWLEDYTSIDYPYQKFDFALIPSFQYGGMEHVGAIQYRADSLFLDESPSQTQLLGRASLISHETAHMWFGDLVTMNWFNDVWTKEVFANFMAAKIVNPGFPEINHNLNFLVRHYPSAYAVDRTEGANPIRQPLPNLNEAGTLYGNIIYNKAPIMMRQLETLIGELDFQSGMQEYLATYAFDNATWPDLIAILDQKTEEDLAAWSQVWVNTAGRPHFKARVMGAEPWSTARGPCCCEPDLAPAFRCCVPPLRYLDHGNSGKRPGVKAAYRDGTGDGAVSSAVLFNADGFGYGLFPVEATMLADWDSFEAVQKGSLLISLYENMLEGQVITPGDYLSQLTRIVGREENQLLLNLSLRQLQTIYWSFVSDVERTVAGEELERVLWTAMLNAEGQQQKEDLLRRLPGYCAIGFGTGASACSLATRTAARRA
jgi:aminopeptidase N